MPSTGLRARVRAQLVEEIKAEARRQLAEDGAPALSLRAVTRALGMASSGIYRYFPSRDALLTALIIDAYDALGEAAEMADAMTAPEQFGQRWLAVSRAVRRWALDHPHEYALVYGSPVPGYRAPEDTIGPAGRVTLVLARIVQDAAAAGVMQPASSRVPLAPPTAAAAAEAHRFAQAAFPSVDEDVALRALGAWTQLFGMVSFELFGHLHGVVEEVDAVFERVVTEAGALLGLPSSPPDAPDAGRHGGDVEPEEEFFLI